MLIMHTDLFYLRFLFISFAVAGAGWGKEVYLLLLTVNQLNVSLPPGVSLLEYPGGSRTRLVAERQDAISLGKPPLELPGQLSMGNTTDTPFSTTDTPFQKSFVVVLYIVPNVRYAS